MILKVFLLNSPLLASMSSSRKRKLTPQQHDSHVAMGRRSALRVRELKLPVEGGLPSQKSNPQRARLLENDMRLEERLWKGKFPQSSPLPVTEAEIAKLAKTRKVIEDNETESASTSSEWEVERKGGKKRILERKARRCLQTRVDLQMANSSQTLLELAAVGPRARESYEKRWLEIKDFMDQNGCDMKNQEQTDALLVTFFNQKYLEGEGSHFGDYTMATLMDHLPSYSRYGHMKLPRAWRSLRGWRKLVPARSRLAYPLAVWLAMSWRMVVRGQLQMAVFNLLQVSTYHRPGTLLKLRKLGLVRPTAGVTGTWSIVTSLTETSDVSKVGTKDDSLLLDSEWLQFINPILEVLARGRKKDRVWTFDYSQYLAVFQACAEDLCLKIVPYQARHSGPSIDRARNARDQDEVRKRGGWMTKTSVNRYEKAGRLAATWQKLDPSIQQCCRTVERYIEDIILGQDYPNIPLPEVVR